MEPGEQILKTRDDYQPVRVARPDQSELAEPPISFVAAQDCSWAQAGDAFGVEKLRSRIEPWLTALAQSEHLSVLMGSGLTHAVHGMATGKALPGMDRAEFEIFGDAIAAESNRLAAAAHRQDGNIEDQIRAASELLRGLEILPHNCFPDVDLESMTSSLRIALTKTLSSFASSILQGESNLNNAEEVRRREALAYLANFLMSFASRSGTRDRVNLFTTNYDRLIEAGADVAGLRLIDRFVGTIAPVFRASRLDVDMHYNPPGIRGEPRYLEGVARLTKLHGSVDWLDDGTAIRRIGLPFGANSIEPYLAASGLSNIDSRRLMIYPNSAKDRETAQHPYVELFRDVAAAICRPNSTLVCYGYGFGDEHINRVIEDMLTIPSTHLVIIAYGDPLGRVMATYERLGRPAQVTLILGDHLGDLRTLVDRYLPKSAIDRTTLRMADLLKVRLATNTDGSTGTPTMDTDGETPAS